MNPQYVATQSALYGFRPFVCFILLLLGIVPGVIYIVYKNLTAHASTIEFYPEKYVIKSGVISHQESEIVFKGVYSVSVSQSAMGRMFNYGTVRADVVGKHDFCLAGIKDPESCKAYLQKRKVSASDINASVIN